jgi:uncharacterized protein (DUF342 family)
MAKKVQNTGSKKHFGTKGQAWISIEITAEGDRAFLRGICFGGDDTLKMQDLVSALEDQFDITTGIDGDVVERIIGQALADPNREYYGKGDLAIASAIKALPGEDGQILHKYLDRISGKVELPHAALRDAMSQPDLDSALAADLRVRAVPPGYEVAVAIPPVKGSPGLDIFGNSTTMVQAPKKAYLRAGPNVRKEEESYISEIFGYVCVTDGQILVLPPVWVSPDGAQAYFIHFPQVGPQVMPQEAWLEQILNLLDLQIEIPTKYFNQLSRFLADNGPRKGSFTLAQGHPPEPGKDAFLACKFKDAGGQDLAELSASAVEDGQLVAEIKAPTKGIAGVNLKGEEIPATDGKTQEFHAGDNVRVELKEGQPRYFYAEISGNAYLVDNTVSVNSVLHIDGDIDESTGDIDAVKDLTVSGSIRAGIKVNAAGTITVGECIEEGAVVRAKGNVVAAQGILGNETRVISLGSVETKFVQGSSIMARYDVTVVDHLFNATVRAGGELIVQPGSGERSGSIVGGEIFASTGIQAETVGSPSSHKTVVGIAMDLSVEAKRKKVTESIDFCNSNLLRIFRTLGVKSFEADQVRTLLKKTPPWRQKATVELLMKTKDLVAY